MAERDPAEDTGESCWICDRRTGDLCFVHERVRDREVSAAQLSWTVAIEPEETTTEANG